MQTHEMLARWATVRAEWLVSMAGLRRGSGPLRPGEMEAAHELFGETIALGNDLSGRIGEEALSAIERVIDGEHGFASKET